MNVSFHVNSSFFPHCAKHELHSGNASRVEFETIISTLKAPSICLREMWLPIIYIMN